MYCVSCLALYYPLKPVYYSILNLNFNYDSMTKQLNISYVYFLIMVLRAEKQIFVSSEDINQALFRDVGYEGRCL